MPCAVALIASSSGGRVKGKFVSYLRVITDKQGRSGLGLEAQRAAVEGYLNGGRWTLFAEYVEAESRQRTDRPKLAKALAHAKAIGATVVFAKLDRLARNVDLLGKLVASDVDLVFCDLPHVPPGAMGRFPLTQMASVAELEAGLISERTKAALAAAKARGVKLGNPNGARALRGKQIGNADAIAAVNVRGQQQSAGAVCALMTISAPPHQQPHTVLPRYLRLHWTIDATIHLSADRRFHLPPPHKRRPIREAPA
jgi:DNA invertase Pin-like site-specific DNA recombinase